MACMQSIYSQQRSWSELIFASARQHYALIGINHGKEKLVQFQHDTAGKCAVDAMFFKGLFRSGRRQK